MFIFSGLFSGPSPEVEQATPCPMADENLPRCIMEGAAGMANVHL